MLVALPSELVLDILKDLPVWDLASIHLVSSTLRFFVEAHEDSVYFNAAVYHRFVPTDATPDQSAQFTPARVRVALGDRSWKDLCTIWFTTEKGWNGRGLVIESTLPSLPGDLRQLYVDEERKFIALDTGDNCILSLESERFLTRLETCPSQSAMSIDEGYMASMNPLGPPYFTIFHMGESGTLAKLLDIHALQDFAFSTAATAFELSLPFLAAVLLGPSSMRVGLWNVHSGQLVCILNPAAHLSNAWFNDHGFATGFLRLKKTHLVVSLKTCVLIVPVSELTQEDEPTRRFIFPSRAMGMDTPEVMLATAVRAHELAGVDSPPAIWSIQNSPAVCMDGRTAMSQVLLAPPLVTLDANSTSIVPWSDTMTEQRFSSATVSPSGRHLAAVNEYGILYLAADFDRVRQSLQSWEAITTKIAFPPPAIQVIWEHEERVVVKAGGALYVVNLDPAFHFTARASAEHQLPLPSFKNLTVHRLNHFSDTRQRMAQGSSAQVTAHGIWTLSTAQLWRRRVQGEMTGQHAADGDYGEVDMSSDVVFVDFTQVGLPEPILPRH